MSAFKTYKNDPIFIEIYLFSQTTASSIELFSLTRHSECPIRKWGGQRDQHEHWNVWWQKMTCMPEENWRSQNKPLGKDFAMFLPKWQRVASRGRGHNTKNALCSRSWWFLVTFPRTQAKVLSLVWKWPPPPALEISLPNLSRFVSDVLCHWIVWPYLRSAVNVGAEVLQSGNSTRRVIKALGAELFHLKMCYTHFISGTVSLVDLAVRSWLEMNVYHSHSSKIVVVCWTSDNLHDIDWAISSTKGAWLSRSEKLVERPLCLKLRMMNALIEVPLLNWKRALGVFWMHWVLKQLTWSWSL